ncbi:hypothetical protein B7486_78645 [cyanobacterium TDX16]|nr:hypothetical protein B7486_78645 [cyanobacterium TDX16]
MARTPTIVGRVFTADEQAYAEAKRDPTERYAVRWAAKEAVMKALGVGLGEVDLKEIEVVRAESGAPSVVLHGRAAVVADARGVTTWQLSLTHTESAAHAIAVAL